MLTAVSKLLSLFRGTLNSGDTLVDLVTERSFPMWQTTVASSDLNKDLERYGLATHVRRSRNSDVAYVLLPWIHPDQVGAMYFETPVELEVKSVRLEHSDRWRVHAIGGFNVIEDPDGTYHEESLPPR